MEYQIAPQKKVKKRPYLILIQKSKSSSAFDEQKVKNITIEYRLQSIFPDPGLYPKTGGVRPNLVSFNVTYLLSFL